MEYQLNIPSGSCAGVELVGPPCDRPCVAVATMEGRFVNEHLGQARRVLIFGPSGGGYKFIETRPTPPKGLDTRWQQLAETLADCHVLFVLAAGTPPLRMLRAAGIRVEIVEGRIDEILRCDYEGGDVSAYYPTDGCDGCCGGFTLIELLTVLTVVAVLMGILLPALNRARKAARALLCRSNMRSTALAFSVYCDSYDGYFPPAYMYVGGSGLRSQPEEPVNGIRHWSGVLLNEDRVTEDALHCPEIPRGGLPPQNTAAANLEPGQPPGREGVTDVQAQRCAFTVNEVLCPRNRFTVGFENAQRPSRLVASSQVRRLSGTILLTEWPRDWRTVSGPDSNLVGSYLPVHGFRNLGQMVGPDRYDLNMTVSNSVRPCLSSATYRRINSDDLSDAPSGSRLYPPRLDWVGRNHPGALMKKNLYRSTFAYLDGHVELKTVYDTVQDTQFEWGEKIYSIAGYNSVK